MTNIREYKLKNLLLDKEFCIANANRDIIEGGAWRMGLDHRIAEIDTEINKLFNQFDSEYERFNSISPYKISMVQKK